MSFFSILVHSVILSTNASYLISFIHATVTTVCKKYKTCEVHELGYAVHLYVMVYLYVLPNTAKVSLLHISIGTPLCVPHHNPYTYVYVRSKLASFTHILKFRLTTMMHMNLSNTLSPFSVHKEKIFLGV